MEAPAPSQTLRPMRWGAGELSHVGTFLAKEMENRGGGN